MRASTPKSSCAIIPLLGAFSPFPFSDTASCTVPAVCYASPLVAAVGAFAHENTSNSPADPCDLENTGAACAGSTFQSCTAIPDLTIQSN
jgi:hypothetical protein